MSITTREPKRLGGQFISIVLFWHIAAPDECHGTSAVGESRHTISGASIGQPTEPCLVSKQRPRVLVGEPSEGLAPMMVSEIYAILSELKRAGRVILLVEQNVVQALTVCDRFVAMERGRLTLAGDARDAADGERRMAAITV